MKKLLSVIIPVYNVQAYLERCVQSVIFQTYQNLEIILVNDGSTDLSGVLCDKLAEKYSRIKVIHKKNGGLSDARNHGLDIATGDYIAFLDSDDWVHRNKYEIVIDVLEKYDVDVVCVRYKNVWHYVCDDVQTYANQVEIITGAEAVAGCYMYKKLFANVWTKVFKRKIIGDSRFVVGKIYEDVFFNHDVLHKTEKVARIQNILCYYYQRPNSIMNSGATEVSVPHLAEGFGRILDYEKEHYIDLYFITIKELYNLIINIYLKRLCTQDKRPWKVKKRAFDLLTELFIIKYADEFNLSLDYSKKRIFAIKLAKKSKTLFRLLFRFHVKIKNKEV